MLWTAPELLNLFGRLDFPSATPGHYGSQQGDIYSLAIILQEILYRCPPYQTTGEQLMVTKGQYHRPQLAIERRPAISANFSIPEIP
jgi:hypothetical protein